MLELLRDIVTFDADVFLLPTSDTDAEILPTEYLKRVNVLRLVDPDFLGVLYQMRCSSNSMCVSFRGEWDLPAKRNYALWYARKHKMTRIFIVDDDIQGLSVDSIGAGANALSQSSIAGYFVENFPDTSAIGHVEIKCGLQIQPFLSGSCLFIRSDEVTDYFPPIYNEDWLFMVSQLARKRVSYLGAIRQKEYDPFASLDVVRFQEPGEIVADGVFSILASNCFEKRFEKEIWRELLTLRRIWLKELSTRCGSTRLREVVNAARERFNEIAELDCVRFMDDWEADRQLWNRTLQEFN